jgi:hypothetical protein
MPDLEDSNPSDNFNFVDRRRVTDSVIENSEVVESPTEDFDSDDTLSEVGPDARPSASIYDVAAYCLGLLVSEGFQRMGLIADPQTGKAVVDLPSARVAIDCVAALVKVLDEPDSTLPEPVKREMKRTLNDLRLNYVDRIRS